MTDREALKQYAESRDAEAFRHLVHTYSGLVYTACTRILGHSAEAEDAAQETFVKLARRCCDVHTNPAGWLYQCAVSTAKDKAKVATVRRERETKWAENNSANSNGDDGATPDLVANIDEAMNELAEDERNLLVEYYFAGKTQEEIADTHEVTQQALSKRIDRAVDSLRTQLGKKGVAVSAVTLTTFLSHSAADAAVPATLTANLMKIGIAGVGEGSAATTAGSGIGGLISSAVPATIGGKVAAVAVAAGIGAGIVSLSAVDNESQSEEVAAVTEDADSTGGRTAENSVQSEDSDSRGSSVADNALGPKAYHRLLKEYRKAAREKNRSGSELEKFHQHWAAKFEKITNTPPTEKNIHPRLTVLSTLGVIQRDRGKGQKAYDVFSKMEREAERFGILPGKIDALEYQFNIASSFFKGNLLSAPELLRLKDRLVKSYRDYLSKPNSSDTYKSLFENSLVDMSKKLLRVYKNEDTATSMHTPSQREELLQNAKALTVTSLDLGNNGDYSEVRKYYTLGKIQRNLGNAQDAHDAFKKALAKNENEFSNLKLGHLAVKALYPNDSDEYQREIERLLNKYPEDRYRNPLAQELAFSFRRADKYDKAIEVFESIQGEGERPGVNATNLYMMGTCYSSLGKTKAANEIFEKVIQKYPDTGTADIAKRDIKILTDEDQ